MIRIKLSELLGKNKMNQKNLAELAKIRPATVSKMYYEEVKRLDIKHINNICKTFNCTISDLLEYVPDNEINEESTTSSTNKSESTISD